MRILGDHDEKKLLALGARIVSEVRDANDVLIAHDVDPDINMAGYDALVIGPTDVEARGECARRIIALASEATQRNLAAYMALLALKPSLTTEEQADVAAFGQAMQWIGAMRATWRDLVENNDEDWRIDAKWPACPQAAIDLAARF